jgi:hypothetical protein
MSIINKIKKLNKIKEKKIYNLLDKKKKYQIRYHNMDNNMNKKKYVIIESNGIKQLVGSYTIYGIFIMSTKLWIWGSSLSNIDIMTIKKINKLKNFSYLFKIPKNKKELFYYQLLTQDTLYITDTECLKWINELLLYLSNGIYYFNPINDNMQFLILDKIKQQFI